MKNAEWMLENGMMFSKLSWGYINGRNIIYYRYRKNKSIAIEIYSEKSVNPENLITKWLDMEHKEQILDDEEREYLAAVIKPFRNDVRYIVKHRSITPFGNFEHIEGIASDMYSDDISYFFILPRFKNGTKYKGMEPDKRYSIEELGL